MKFGCIGEKLGHSFSVEIHEKIGLYDYVLMPLSRDELDGFMKRREFDGINVTIPYKKDVIPYLETMSEEAKLCGAVNTIVKRDGKLHGYNTDFAGMRDMLAFGGIEIAGKNVLILGSGGTAGTALKLCRYLGAARAELVSRGEKEGCISYEEAYRRRDTQIIINCTPCGMYPNAGTSPVELKRFPQLCGVADAVYNPQKTEFLMQAEELGIPSVGGLFMLVSQALYAADIFTGRSDLVALAPAIHEAVRSEKENIVLTGMPGAGKSTIGKALAELLGREMIDSDAVIVEEEKKPIPDIFREEGEKAFRDIESRVIRSLSALRGKIIATGGGVILREENVRYLKSNGKLIFLDAPLETLMPTADRPVASTAEDLKKRYEQRYDIYVSTADAIVSVTRDVEENLKKIKQVL